MVLSNDRRKGLGSVRCSAVQTPTIKRPDNSAAVSVYTQQRVVGDGWRVTKTDKESSEPRSTANASDYFLIRTVLMHGERTLSGSAARHWNGVRNGKTPCVCQWRLQSRWLHSQCTVQVQPLFIHINKLLASASLTFVSFSTSGRPINCCKIKRKTNLPYGLVNTLGADEEIKRFVQLHWLVCLFRSFKSTS